MPSSATITAFYNFSALTIIRSSEVNNNFDAFRGHLIAIDPSTSTAAATMTYDLGSYDKMWRGAYNQYGIMYANTAGSIPTPATSTAYALYFKNDGRLYSKDSVGGESEVGSGVGTIEVSIKYQNTAGTTISSSNTDIPFPTQIYASSAAAASFDGTVFTAPSSGVYLVCSNLLTNAVANSTSQAFSIQCVVKSTPESLTTTAGQLVWITNGTGGTVSQPGIVVKEYKLSANDTINIRATNSNTITLSTGVGRNVLSIRKVAQF